MALPRLLKTSLPSIFDTQRNAAKPPSNPGADEPFRPLSTAEQSLLRHLLDSGDSIAQSFLPQLEHLQARSSCRCGCPSIALLVSDEAPRSPTDKNILVDDIFGYTDKKLVGLIIFAKDGKLAEMEAYDVSSQFEGPYAFPLISTLTANLASPAVYQE